MCELHMFPNNVTLTSIHSNDKIFFSSLIYKNERKKHKFQQQKITKSDCYNENKKIFNIDDIGVNTILVSKKEQYGKYNSFKYFIEYNHNNVIRPLYLGLSQMTSCINKFDENKNKNKITMSLMVKGKHLLKN